MRLHRVQCLGLIDRDDLSHERIESNRQDGVYVSPVADIENLFLIPSVARHIYRIVGIEEVFNEIEGLYHRFGHREASSPGEGLAKTWGHTGL